MVDPKVLKGLAVFSAGYLKRWLEGNFYDKIFKTQLAENLKRLDKKAHYGIEFGLNLLNAFFDERLSEDTALKKFVKEVGLDVGPEISKRLMNNTKEKLNSNARSSGEKELVSILLELDDKILVALLNWLYSIEKSEREQVIIQLSRLSFDELVKFAGLPTDDKKRILDLLKAQSSKKPMNRIDKQLESINKKWEIWLSEKRRKRDTTSAK